MSYDEFGIQAGDVSAFPVGGDPMNETVPDEIDLDFGGVAYEPLPEGVYRSFLTDANWERTKNKEMMAVLKWTVETPAEYEGRIFFDRWVIPSAAARDADPEKWKNRMYYLQLKLEAVTGRLWRSNNMRLNLQRDLIGSVAMAVLTIGEYDGKPNNSVEKYMPAQGTTATSLGIEQSSSSSDYAGFGL